MKKGIFTSLILGAMSLVTANATEYTDTLKVTIDYGGTIIECTPTESTVYVEENEDGTYTLSLKNFVLNLLGDEMALGNIVIENVAATSNDYSTYLATSQSIAITDGDDDSYVWVGSALTGGLAIIPVDMVGKIYDDSFYTTIDIDFSGMAITVEFGETTYQLPNAGFEEFHTATYGSYTSDEPNGWHSFMSSTGTLAAFVSTTAQTAISEDVRPGSEGSYSVLVKSRAILGISANGTITTGRLKAGSMTASSTDNCSYLDTSDTDTDGNGDPFYTLIDGQPDSLAVWVKYHVGTRSSSNEDNVYATISAIITDGTYYQDPEDDETYTNVVAKAVTTEVGASTDDDGEDEWQLITLPFDYESYVDDAASTKALLVTVSTCAVPGGGSTSSSDVDIVYVDDISLIYNNKLETLTVSGSELTDFDADVYTYDLTVAEALTLDDIEATADGVSAYVLTTIEDADDSQTVTVEVISCDLESTNTYTINVTIEQEEEEEGDDDDDDDTTDGINGVESDITSTDSTIYTVSGQRVNGVNGQGLYLVRKADGSVVKVLKK